MQGTVNWFVNYVYVQVGIYMLRIYICHIHTYDERNGFSALKSIIQINVLLDVADDYDYGELRSFTSFRIWIQWNAFYTSDFA